MKNPISGTTIQAKSQISDFAPSLNNPWLHFYHFVLFLINAFRGHHLWTKFSPAKTVLGDWHIARRWLWGGGGCFVFCSLGPFKNANELLIKELFKVKYNKRRSMYGQYTHSGIAKSISHVGWKNLFKGKIVRGLLWSGIRKVRTAAAYHKLAFHRNHM